MQCKNLQNPPYPGVAVINLNLFVEPYFTLYPFKSSLHYPVGGAAFVWINWFICPTGSFALGDYTFYIQGTAITSQVFKLHDANDNYFLNNSFANQNYQ